MYAPGFVRNPGGHGDMISSSPRHTQKAIHVQNNLNQTQFLRVLASKLQSWVENYSIQFWVNYEGIWF